MNYHLDFCTRYFKNKILFKRYKTTEIFVGSLLQTDGRLKSTLFYTDDYQHLKTRLLSTDNFHLYRRVQGRGEMMEHEFLEQFISLTSTKLTANV